MISNKESDTRRYSGYLDKISKFGCVQHSPKLWRERRGAYFRIRTGTILMMVLLGYLRLDGKRVYPTSRGKYLMDDYREKKAEKRRVAHLRRKELVAIGVLR